MTLSILWLRQDLRLADNPALHAALAEGAVLPVYILDNEDSPNRAMGSAQRWWLHHSLASLSRRYETLGARIIIRQGNSAKELRAIANAVQAKGVYANRHYEPWHKAREADVGSDLRLELYEGNVLIPPDDLLNGQGQRYRVFTPWHRKLQTILPDFQPIPAPSSLPPIEVKGLYSLSLSALKLLPESPDWSGGFSQWGPGESGAWDAFDQFLPSLSYYSVERDHPSMMGTSRLSPHIHFGEISMRSLWDRVRNHAGEGASVFRSEVAWRDYSINLMDQFPHYGEENGRPIMGLFEWRSGAAADRDFWAWCRGQTGYPIVDAGMRELWQTGWMHNRVRMIVASFLVKHLLIDWRRGEQWFWDTLLDADYGANAMNWQYVAGTGVDAPVFSRIMSPKLQCEKFRMADYIRQYVPELSGLSDKAINRAHEAGANVQGYPNPLVSHAFARERALNAWAQVRLGA